MFSHGHSCRRGLYRLPSASIKVVHCPPTREMATTADSSLRSTQARVATTSFLSLFSIVGIALYGLPFFYDFMVRDFGWTRAQVTSGNALSKLIVGPLLGFAAGWMVDRFGPRPPDDHRHPHGGHRTERPGLDHDAHGVLPLLYVQRGRLPVWRAAPQFRCCCRAGSPRHAAKPWASPTSASTWRSTRAARCGPAGPGRRLARHAPHPGRPRSLSLHCRLHCS